MEKTNALTRSLTSNQIKDFWLLGGLSILLWALLICIEPIRNSTELLATRFIQLPILFAWLSLLCNYPHFLISYRFGYTRGIKFILKNWFSLIAVPVLLIFIFSIGYLFFTTDIATSSLVHTLNFLILKIGFIYQIGNTINFGTEVLSFTVRIMYATVGWHYSKQIFGCMMVYGNYSDYRFSNFQRLLIKISLFSIAFYNFFYMSVPATNTATTSYFFNIPIQALGFSKILVPFFQISTVISFAMVSYFVFYKKYKETKKIIPLNILVPYLAFHIWWIPPIRQNEFYFLFVPFFHSLQYLPFAYRLEIEKGEKSNNNNFYISFKLLSLIFAGALAFEIIPNFLDIHFNSYSNLGTWYFMISFAVFINIHHFFIDSTIWKFNDNKVRERLFSI